MTSLLDGRARAGVGFAAPGHRCRASSAARPPARPVHSVHRHKEICMPEIARATPQAISDLTGTWTLVPRRTMTQFQTKATWVLNVNGTLRATEGSGAVDGNGQVTGRLVVDVNSIDTKNKSATPTLRGADIFKAQKHPTMVLDVQVMRLRLRRAPALHVMKVVRLPSRLPQTSHPIRRLLPGSRTIPPEPLKE
jgi:YceI-like domain